MEKLERINLRYNRLLNSPIPFANIESLHSEILSEKKINCHLCGTEADCNCPYCGAMLDCRNENITK